MANYLVCFLFCFVASCPSAQAALHPSEVAVLANSSFAGSRELAEYYCKARNIPTSHIISLPMPDGEWIARSLYEKSIAPQVSRELEKMPQGRAIRCLVTVRGVPLRIGPAQPTAQERILTAKLRQNSKQALAELDDLLKQAHRLAGLPEPLPMDDGQNSSRNHGPQLVKRTLEQINRVAKRINSIPESLYKQKLDEEFGQIQGDLFGLAGRIELLKSQEPFPPTDPRAAQLAKLKEQFEQTNQQIAQLMRSAATPEQLDEAAKLARTSRGVLGLFQQLDASVALINHPYQKSNSSFDSELSLVLAGEYPRREFLANLLCLDYPATAQDKPRTLMVSRIDGPSAAIARGLIDKAIRAQAGGLKGKAYIDAGWYKAKRAGYTSTEKSLLATAKLLQQYSPLPVVLDTKDEVFPPGSCPDAALYCGWYSLKNYVDAFDWVEGAVGYHIASFELVSLRDPKFNGWATAMLRDGITATLGAVDEPLLAAFPPPDKFFTLLLTGKFSLVECFYMTKRFNSWQLVLIGDPLYTPFASNPRLTIPQAEQILNHKLANTP